MGENIKQSKTNFLNIHSIYRQLHAKIMLQIKLFQTLITARPGKLQVRLCRSFQTKFNCKHLLNG